MKMFSRKTTIVCAAAAALSLAGVTASAATTWSGQDWDTANNATLSVNGPSNLEVTATKDLAGGYSWGGAHIGTDTAFRDADTPYVQATFLDNGNGAYLAVDQETGTPKAWLGIGALHSDDTTYSLKLTNDSSPTSTVINLGARDNGEHTVLLGRRTDGSVDFVFDGVLKYHSAADVSSFFGDIYLNTRNTASNLKATFTSFEMGTNYDYTAVPEPSSLAVFVGLGGLALLSRRTRRKIA